MDSVDKMQPTRIVIVGHVDHGKSTLIGKMLHEAKMIPLSKVTELEHIASKQGTEIEYSNALDALEEEQKQNITIDTTQIFFKTKTRDYVIIDAPGHKEFLKNMVTGASSADVAVLIIDAHEGVKEQTRRHTYFLSLLGIRNIIIGINKMDKVNYREDIYLEICREINLFFQQLNLNAFKFIPISAKYGENVSYPSENMKWYCEGTMLDTFDQISNSRIDGNQHFRMPIQDIYKQNGERILAGRVESGRLKSGEIVTFSPSLKQAKVLSIIKWNNVLSTAESGECIGLTIDDDLFLERGELTSRIAEKSPIITDHFRANVFWLGKNPLCPNKKYLLKIGTEEVDCEISEITKRLNSSTLSIEEDTTSIHNTESGEIVVATKRPIALDLFFDSKRTGRFVIVDEYDVCGGGIVIENVMRNSPKAS